MLAANPMANALTPSGQQSGLKMNVNLPVPAGQVADFAIDFDACKSFVKAGNSGKYLLKPGLSVIPILSAAGQRIVGFVDRPLGLRYRHSFAANPCARRLRTPRADSNSIPCRLAPTTW